MDLYEEMGYGKKKDSAIPAVVSTPAPNSQIPQFEVSIKPGDPDYEFAKTDPVGYSKKLLVEQKAAMPVAQAEPTVKPTPTKKAGGVDLFNEMYGAEAKKPLRVKQAAPVEKEGVMEGLVVPTGEAALRVGGALAGSLATGTGAIVTHVPYMVHDIYKEIKKGKSFKDAFNEGMTKASNRSIETMEFPAKELLKTPEQQESFEKIMTPLGLAGAGWRGMAEYAATGDLQKAADVAEGKSMGSSVLVPWAGAFGDTAFMYALMGKNAVKARWYQMTVKERALVREAAKEVKANIKDSNLTNEQVKELWRDPANREGLRRRFVFGETEEVAAKPPTEPPTKASGVTEQPVVGYEKGKVHPLADMMNVLPEAEMLDLAGAKGEGFTVKPVVEGVVKRGAYDIGEVPRVLPVEYKPYISRNGRPFATEEKAEAVALERGFNPKEFEVVPVEVGQYKGFGYVRTTPVKQKLPIPGQESLAKRIVREVVEERKSEIPEGKLEVPVQIELPKPVELSKFDQMKLETLQKTDPALWNASDKVFMQKLGQPMPMGTPAEKPLTAPAESYAGQRAPEAVERMSEAYSEQQRPKAKPEPKAEPVEEPAFKVTDKRSFKDILNDINTALGKKGEVGKDIEVAPESAAARARLREDLARFSEAAKREGKDVEQYMKESGMSAEMLAALTKLNREVGDIEKPPVATHGTTVDNLDSILSNGLRPGSALDFTSDRGWSSEYEAIVEVPSAKKGKYVEHNKFYTSAGNVKPSKVIIDLDNFTDRGAEIVKTQVAELKAKHPNVEFELLNDALSHPESLTLENVTKLYKKKYNLSDADALESAKLEFELGFSGSDRGSITTISKLNKYLDDMEILGYEGMLDDLTSTGEIKAYKDFPKSVGELAVEKAYKAGKVKTVDDVKKIYERALEANKDKSIIGDVSKIDTGRKAGKTDLGIEAEARAQAALKAITPKVGLRLKPTAAQRAKDILTGERGSLILGERKPFYSKLEEVINSKMRMSMPIEQLRKTALNNGVTVDEWNDVFKGVKGTITKKQALDELAVNGVKFKDVVLGEKRVPNEVDHKIFNLENKRRMLDEREGKVLADLNAMELDVPHVISLTEGKVPTYTDMSGAIHDVPQKHLAEVKEIYKQKNKISHELHDLLLLRIEERHPTPTPKYEQYSEPGYVPGSYRELFVTAPGEIPYSFTLHNKIAAELNRLDISPENSLYRQQRQEVLAKYGMTTEQWNKFKKLNWQDGHNAYSDIQNPIVRLRLNEREVNGKRVLFIEEMQGPSAANQAKMPESLRNRIYDIGVKRAIQYAKDNGFNEIAWTTGEMQAERYNLSKYIDEVTSVRTSAVSIEEYTKAGDKLVNKYNITIKDKQGRTLSSEVPYTAEELPNVVGKDLANKIINSSNKVNNFSDLDLKVGGEGLKRLYDETIPGLMEKYSGGKKGTTDLKSTEGFKSASELTAEDYAKLEEIIPLREQESFKSQRDLAENLIDFFGDWEFVPKSNKQKVLNIISKQKTEKVQSVPITEKTPSSFTLYEGVDPTQTIAVLKGLAKNTREAYNYLSEVGQRIYSSGKTDFVSWRNEFKTVLGELWEQYKTQVAVIWNKLKTGVLKPLMNERGSVGYDIGGERIAKQRDLGTLEDGTKLKAPAITEKEFKLLRSLPDMKKKPIGGFTQNPIYAFEDWAASVGPKAQTWVKEKFYYPIREATHRADLHFKNIFDQVEARRKNLPHSSSRRIYYYAISKEAGGAEILKNMGVKEVPKLTEGELEAYNWMRKGYESMYNQINAARIASGIEPIAKVKDYFTFAADMTLAEELGFGFNDAMLGKFVHPKATRFRYAIERIGGIQKVHTDGFGIFERYMKAATKHIYLSPEIAKMREFTGKFDIGKGKTWSMQRSQPRAYANITKYLDFLTGERRTILPDAIERAMVMLNKNITTATLSANLRSALIQPTALHNTYIEIGPKYTMKGAIDLMRGKGAEAIQKSKVLFNREFDIDIKQTYEGVFGRIGSIKKAINDSWLGMKPLKYLDMQTATTTWLGAFEKAKEVYKMPEEKAIRYADDTVIRTQGSAAAHDLAPLQRIALGRFFSTFQSFVINNFNFLAKDVVGIKNPMMKPAESLHKVGRYVLGAVIINTIFEEVLGINSPLPAPVRAAKKTYDKNGSEKEAAVSAMLELLQVVPGFGGLRYGSGVTGAGVDYLKDVTNKLAEEAGEYRGKTKSWGELAGKAMGIPGTGQVTKTTKILEKGGTLPEAILGRYPDTSKNELLNLKKETSFNFDKE